MSTSKRPMSPYMLGPYYKFQITSLLSILNRLSGIYLSLVTAPLLLLWIIALATGEQAFTGLGEWLGGMFGKMLIVVSVFSFSFHFFCGIRHLIWDAGWMMEMQQVNLSGWAAIIASVLLSLIVLGAGL